MVRNCRGPLFEMEKMVAFQPDSYTELTNSDATKWGENFAQVFHCWATMGTYCVRSK